MSIDYKIIYQKVIDLRCELFFQLGQCYINNKSFEKVLISFVKNLECILYPNVSLGETLPIKEIKHI